MSDGKETPLGNVSTAGYRMTSTNAGAIQDAIQQEFVDHAKTLPFKDWMVGTSDVLNEHIRFRIKYTRGAVDQSFRNAILARWSSYNAKLRSSPNEDVFFIEFSSMIDKVQTVNTLQKWNIWDKMVFYGLFFLMGLLVYILYCIDPDRYPFIARFFEYIPFFRTTKEEDIQDYLSDYK